MNKFWGISGSVSILYLFVIGIYKFSYTFSLAPVGILSVFVGILVSNFIVTVLLGIENIFPGVIKFVIGTLYLSLYIG